MRVICELLLYLNMKLLTLKFIFESLNSRTEQDDSKT